MSTLPPVVKAGLQSGTIMTLADFLTQVAIEGKKLDFSTLTGTGPGIQKSSESESGQSLSGTTITPSSTSTSSLPQQSLYDPIRTIRWSFAGLLIHGPYFLLTFRRIDLAFANWELNLKTVLAKTTTAQFTAFPGYLGLLFAYMGICEGRHISTLKFNQESNSNESQWDGSIEQKLSQRVPEAFAGGCIFWPIANTINFSLIPATMRVPYLASCGSVWNCFLSWLNARAASAASDRDQKTVGSSEIKSQS